VTADPPTTEDLLSLAQDAVMAGRSHDALQLCDRAALQSDDGRYGAALLRGTILLDMGDAAGALSSYDSVADPQVPDPTLDCARGLALFELARLAEAENALRSALRGSATLARAHFALGLIAELSGNGEEAEHFRKARRLEPENYPPQRRVGNDEFQQAVTDAIESLGDGVQLVLGKISVLVAELPNPQDLLRQNPPVSPQAPCMLVGVLEAPQDLEDGLEDVEVGLLLFKRNLERLTQSQAELTHTVREALLATLAGTFEGDSLRSPLNDADDERSQDAEADLGAETRHENAKLHDLHAFRRKKGMLPKA
jgi:tetratricopeptide (TPR) repeat protein